MTDYDLEKRLAGFFGRWQGNLGTDLDETRFPINDKILEYLNHYVEKTKWIKLNLKYEDWVIYSIEDLKIMKENNIIGDDVIEALKIMGNEGVLESVKPYPYSIEPLILIQRFHNIYDLTARSERYYYNPKQKTEICLKKIESETGFYPNGVVYNGNKLNEIKKLNITRMIEDKGSTLIILLDDEELKNREFKGILLDKPWNRMNKEDDLKLFPEEYKKKQAEVQSLNKYEKEGRLIRLPGPTEQSWKLIYDVVLRGR